MKHVAVRYTVFFSLIFMYCYRPENSAGTVVWTLDQPHMIGGHNTMVAGEPEIVEDTFGVSVSFNGVDDGLIVRANPVEGWWVFTVEVLFKPHPEGPLAQRFVHIQDEEDNGGRIETKLNPDGTRAVDIFFYNSTDDTGMVLIDRDALHLGGRVVLGSRDI